ncbi:flagellar basal body-associated FliL family protein [Marivita sp.]|jgi:flagellar FliL protein|uniref:flagellar basal body-associated FliL family protein n=1 Tax=Marivita sp. TaxID=2003365 RepID=UPI003218F352
MALAETIGTESGENAKKSSKMVLILSVVLCVAGGGLGFFALSSGLVPIGNAVPQETESYDEVIPLANVAFVEIPTLIVTLPPGAKNDHLRFTGLIEVPSEHQGDVEFLMPRIQDVLNGYLRALTIEDIEGPGALFKIRLQLFRRIVVVVGLGKANGLLVTEFILN